MDGGQLERRGTALQARLTSELAKVVISQKIINYNNYYNYITFPELFSPFFHNERRDAAAPLPRFIRAKPRGHMWIWT